MQRVVGLIERHDPAVRQKIFVDVGANIGTSSVTALREFSFARAVAIEPDADNFALLERNRELNGLSGRMTLVHAAATRTRGAVWLRVNPRNPGAHRVVEASSAQARPAGTIVKVPGVTLTDVLADNQIEPHDVGIFWMDVQGHEARVLEGATAVLEAAVPICLELYPRALRKNGGTELLFDLVRRRYTHCADLRSRLIRKISLEEIGTLPDLAEKYAESYTDVVLLSCDP